MKVLNRSKLQKERKEIELLGDNPNLNYGLTIRVCNLYIYI